jgi:hypothetical protein
MSRNHKRLHHDGGLFGIKRQRWGFWRNLFPEKCLAHDGGVIDKAVGTRRLVNRCDPINHLPLPHRSHPRRIGDTSIDPQTGGTVNILQRPVRIRDSTSDARMPSLWERAAIQWQAELRLTPCRLDVIGVGSKPLVVGSGRSKGSAPFLGQTPFLGPGTRCCLS